MNFLHQKTNWSQVEEGDTCISDNCRGTMRLVMSPSGILYLECDQKRDHGRITFSHEVERYNQKTTDPTYTVRDSG